MRFRILSWLFIIIIIHNGCIEEFNPKIEDYKDILIVEGIITNDAGPYIVKLSKSSPVYKSLYLFDNNSVSNAKIVISDDNNIEEILSEIEPGIYSTSPLGIRGEVGRKYRITIDLDGKAYQSNYEELKEPVGIDSVYSKIEYQETTSGNVNGLQFYVDTKAFGNAVKHILWIPVETYKFTSDARIDFVCSGIDWNGFIIDKFNYTWYDTCYRTENIAETFIYSTKYLPGSKINNLPLHYVNTTTKKLLERYSLNVNQYTVSEAVYNYWYDIKRLNSTSGSLYETHPYQVKGNILNINNSEDLIVGYFMVAGVSKKRVFVNKPQLKFYNDVCEPNVQKLGFFYEHPKDLPYYPYYTALNEDGETGVIPYECGDCRTVGSNIKPDFWVD